MNPKFSLALSFVAIAISLVSFVLGMKNMRQPPRTEPAAAYVLNIAGRDTAQHIEFTTMEACAEASVYYKVGSSNRLVAECVAK